MPAIRRTPTHAGSWYTNSGDELAAEIDAWMQDVQPHAHAQAIIAPHAGYSYCGHVMAHAYRHIDASKVSRVFLLGPSHHRYSRKCMLSAADIYHTPLGNMTIDQDVYQQLLGTGAFDVMDLATDEAEHSLELHTPFLMRTMAGKDFKLVPIMVGNITPDLEAQYGRILGPYLNDPANCFIISSDFCHWGSRFSFTFNNRSLGPIWKSIQWLDEQGIAAIETGHAEPFTAYLAEYSNTICGRHPIGVLLNMLAHCEGKYAIKFNKYAQSSQCQTMSDSSVSYAAATVTRTQEL